MNPSIPKISDHGEKRLRHRRGIPKKKAKEFTEQIYENSLKAIQTKGLLKKYLYKLWCTDKNTDIRVHQQKVYIFGYNRTLITVLHLPYNLRNSADNQESKNKFNIIT